MTRYYRDANTGATASITTHRDGTATLRTFIAGKRKQKKYSNAKSAYNAWYRMCN